MMCFTVLGISLGVFTRLRGEGQLTACQSNLKNLATALEMYASDNKDLYPRKLGDVLPGHYLKIIPTCPACSEDSYSRSYQAQGTKFTLFCRGDNHARALAGPYTQNQPDARSVFPTLEDHP